MSGGFSIKLRRDDITPDLRKKLAALKDPTPIWRAVGTQLVSYTRRSFRDPSLRIAPWRAKRDGTPSNLIQKGILMSSIRITALAKSSVTIGSDRRYAAIHQLGGRTIFAKKVTMPARPFFPFLPDGSLAPKARAPIREIVISAANKALGL